MFGAGQQILPRPRRGGCSEHYEGYLYQELFRRHQSDHSANAISQQGNLKTDFHYFFYV